ncbi:ubiquitin domain-containing protein UBFD1-like isoform X4 [Tachypleus tridentatus]|uniref:ubiquitin domain-containing protein UBFD1-like isoform X4 n=1 Tax=Tachypleus tridentatus TaxID=6853 RepID=UPI003FD68DC7
MASDGEVNNTEGCSSNGDLLEASVCSSAKAEIMKEMIDFKVVYNKQKFDVSFPYDETVGALKQHIHTLTGVPPAMQKVMIKGPTKEPLCRQKIHKKVIDKGVPDDCMPGIKNAKESLPPFPLSGMVNKSGGKVRLTFKLEVDQLWIGTKERTEKVGMNSIKNVISEPIEGHEEYHIMGLQLGPTEASRYWIYWVPAQYVDAIKDAVLGKWQYF